MRLAIAASLVLFSSSVAAQDIVYVRDPQFCSGMRCFLDEAHCESFRQPLEDEGRRAPRCRSVLRTWSIAFQMTDGEWAIALATRAACASYRRRMQAENRRLSDAGMPHIYTNISECFDRRTAVAGTYFAPGTLGEMLDAPR